MRVQGLLTIAAVGLMIGAAPAGDEVKKEKEKLQGSWKVVTFEKGGKSAEDNQDHRVVISGDELSIKRGDQTFIKGKLKIDPTKKPRHFDVEITEDAENKFTGKTAQGIYQLDKDELKWCVCEPGSDVRPTEFSTQAGDVRICITLKRE
jgi:uncharacterized protein (TIGR03067 family)